jgi:hypothetical protein
MPADRGLSAARGCRAAGREPDRGRSPRSTAWARRRRARLWTLGALDYRELERWRPRSSRPSCRRSKSASGLGAGLLEVTPGDHVMRLYRARLEALGI